MSQDQELNKINYPVGPIPEQVISVCDKLKDQGYEAYLVGGCVRDLIVGKEPKDYDVATSAGPLGITGIFGSAKEVGKHFSVFLVNEGNHPVEVATFRTEGPYSDHRRPDYINSSTLLEDTRRRDFTVNALYYDTANRCIIDQVGGLKDIINSTIRTVGDPRARFSEDYLRMLRAVRFRQRLNNGVIDKDTALAINEFAPNLHLVSKERITDELRKILEAPSGLSYLSDIDLYGRVADFFNANDDSAIRVFSRIKPVYADICSALAILSFYADQYFANGKTLVNLLNSDESVFRLTNSELKEINWTLQSVYRIFSKDMSLCEIRRFLNNNLADKALHIAGLLSGFDRNIAITRYISEIVGIRAVFKNMNMPLIEDPVIKGDDLVTVGIEPSHTMGVVLTKAYEYQLNNGVRDRGIILSKIREWLDEYNEARGER